MSPIQYFFVSFCLYYYTDIATVSAKSRSSMQGGSPILQVCDYAASALRLVSSV